jgi:hypothetical protein
MKTRSTVPIVGMDSYVVQYVSDGCARIHGSDIYIYIIDSDLPNGIHHNICDKLDGCLGWMDRIPVEVLGGVCACSSASACLANLNHPRSTSPS